MTFWEHFLRVLCRRPLPALAALYWHLTKRKVRARNRLRVASADLPFAYAVWIANNELTEAMVHDCDPTIAQWAWRPRFLIQIHSVETATACQIMRSIGSVECQIYPDWRLIESSPGPTISIQDVAEEDFLIPLRAGDLLSKTALFHFAEALQRNPNANILYGDQDSVDGNGRRTRPWFKPRWNEELFLAQDYISSLVAIDNQLSRRVAVENDGDLLALLLTATGEATSIVHVPHVLVHVADESPPKQDRLHAVARHLEPRGANCVLGPFETVKVEWPLPEQLPLVSVIIPTKDKLEVLEPCVQSVIARTNYPNFEIIIVDNGSVETTTTRFLTDICKDPRVSVISYDLPFNYSAINNFAVQHSRGTYLCLLNNDTEVIEPAWLTELMRYAVRPEVGAAGAKLLYEDGSIQHAGVVIGIGEAAGHAHRLLPANQSGYFAMPHAAQYVSAVTGACLIVEKQKFVDVGGLDEVDFAIAFNDVDLCLKLEAAGWRNVYVPHAVLIHHESKSRESDMAPAQRARYQRELQLLQERWGTKTYQDPLHNPNLDRSCEAFVIRI